MKFYAIRGMYHKDNPLVYIERMIQIILDLKSGSGYIGLAMSRENIFLIFITYALIKV